MKIASVTHIRDAVRCVGRGLWKAHLAVPDCTIAWFGALPEGLRDTAAAEALRTIIDLDLGVLSDAQPPRAFGRD
jgi:hypothetical protein